MSDPLVSDADMATAAAHEALKGYCWAGGLGWRKYDDRRGIWVPVPEEATVERVRRWMLVMSAVLLRRAADEAKAGKSGEYYQNLAESWRKHATAARIAAITRLARGICLTGPERFDTHPDLLNCADGVLDLRTGKLGDHDPALLLTQTTGTRYKAGARHPDIDKALQAIPDDARAYAQLRYGQGITGYKPPDDAIDVQHGSGENGKTTVLTAISRAIGSYYAVLPQRVFLANPDAHTTDLMTLRGVRIGVIEELPEDHQLSVNRIKIATAPTITARWVHKDNVTFANCCALIISTNYRLQIRETDHGTWRRLEASIPFPYTFRKPHERIRDENDRKGDPTLRQRIENDDGTRAEAMLAWLADGAVRWYAGEPGRPPRTMGEPPKSVLGDVRAWRESCDLLYGYMSEHIDWDPDAHVISEELRDEVNRWLRSRGHREWSMETLTGRLEVHSEAREHRVTKIRPRAGQEPGLSRPPGYEAVAVKDRYTGWSGMRFRPAQGSQYSSGMNLQDSVSAGRSGWSDPKQTPLREASRRGFTWTPDHSDQAGSGQIPGYDWAALWARADFSG